MSLKLPKEQNQTQSCKQNTGNVPQFWIPRTQAPPKNPNGSRGSDRSAPNTKVARIGPYTFPFFGCDIRELINSNENDQTSQSDIREPESKCWTGCGWGD
jgi:hypothetical protein